MTEESLVSYSGLDELNVMKLAENYNHYLTSHIIKAIRSTSPPIKDCLDFGAGTGLFAEKLAARDYKIICIEADKFLFHKLQLMKKDHSISDVFENLQQLNGRQTPFIYSLNVLEHIEDDRQILKDLHHHLLPSGRLFLFLPAFNILYSSMDKKVSHFRRYHKKELVNKVESAGFRVLRCRYVDSLGFFAALLYKYIGSKEGDINPRSLIFFDRFIFPLSKAIDCFTNRFFGKNIMLIAEKKEK